MGLAAGPAGKGFQPLPDASPGLAARFLRITGVPNPKTRILTPSLRPTAPRLPQKPPTSLEPPQSAPQPLVIAPLWPLQASLWTSRHHCFQPSPRRSPVYAAELPHTSFQKWHLTAYGYGAPGVLPDLGTHYAQDKKVIETSK